jgi:hypothetical protein
MAYFLPVNPLMKVIIQDIAAHKFLAENGHWSNDKCDAQDFFSLLRAYHFAQSNVSGRFQVLLHCPDDGYVACIIEGVGAVAEQEIAEVAFDVPVVKSHRPEAKEQISREMVWNGRIDTTKFHLN